MNVENHDYRNHLRDLHDECKNHMYYHVTLTMTDGSTFDGIIENVDMDNITVLAGEDVMERESEGDESDTRQYYGPFGRPRRRFRRFRRRGFPLASLAALALLPYIAPPPYPYYPYPYYY
ncbi:small nuclear ribonucleoprotein [Salipaludibacillus sp. CF4.18]|uniref:small nuclear ribonucleoprotein n=1 Tax=Salipaludibacillus sp. CF4.18 TaxID=3373081 RepID=UPI003EE6E0EF